MTDIAAVAEGLTEPQLHFVLMSSDAVLHPHDIDVHGSTAMALVRRGMAYRTVCTITGTDEQFNGYGLTPLGLTLRKYLKEQS